MVAGSLDAGRTKTLEGNDLVLITQENRDAVSRMNDTEVFGLNQSVSGFVCFCFRGFGGGLSSRHMAPREVNLSFFTPGGCKTLQTPAGSLVCGFEEGEENNSDGNTHTVKPTKYLPQNGEFLVIVHQ